MPRENPARFSCFDPLKHRIENRPAQSLGRPLFNQLGNDAQMVALGKLAQISMQRQKEVLAARCVDAA